MTTTIEAYTGNWQAELRPSAPRAGELVRIALEPDAREWDDFRRVLRSEGLDLRWERFMPRARMDVHVVVAATGEDNAS